MLKRTPLFEKHLALTAKIVPFAGWEMPVSYPAGIIAEHNAVRNSVGLFDIGHMGLIKITNDGPALNLIQSATTNDASKLEINQCQYSVLCNQSGGVVDDLLVYRLPKFYLVIANASNADKVVNWLQSFPQKATVVLDEEHCAISVQGPKAGAAVEQLLNMKLGEQKRNHVLWIRDIMVSRTGYTGEDGYELIVAKKEAAVFWEAFIKQGVQPCGLGARDTLRLEAGLPLYGHEYNESTTPLEAGYGWAVKFDKGDFVGRQALLEEKEAGLRKQLVGIEMEGRAIPRQGNSTFDIGNSKLLGQVTSGTFSPTLKKPIALAYLTPNFLPLTPVSVEIRGEKLPGRVVDKAFYKRVK